MGIVNRLDQVKDRIVASEYAGGADTVEYVFGIIVAVGLGAALLIFQGQIRNAITNTGNAITNTFNSLTANGVK